MQRGGLLGFLSLPRLSLRYRRLTQGVALPRGRERERERERLPREPVSYHGVSGYTTARYKGPGRGFKGKTVEAG
ncbi:hypothetical protein BDV37DRAFT_237298 [Aspergillus pseudonomiae]|uniref:Uncharacterized protein n=1 Tax=Aspergillus pseudonomiae TaxID=1506151 RepID=A0A5N7DTJ4_9EURO|nr:uncharacterized protein BDV37DRAFT_237298 [Aspergillus pseudonomiae]KAE8409359.1 hypothetical protein BDV37DRAFT_237298 [Aspergillus pseudonomiae]